MKVIGLWSPDHLGSLSSLIAPVVALPTAGPTDTTNTLNTSSTLNTLSMFDDLSPALRCASLDTKGVAYLTFPSMTKAKAAWGDVTNQLYFGCRIRTGNIKAASKLITYNSTTAGPTVTSNTEYFIEFVYDLVNSVRTSYFNGVSYNISAQYSNSDLWVGSYSNTPLLNAAYHHLLFGDVYMAMADTGELNPPARLGKLMVKSMPVVSTGVNDRFTPIGADTVVEALNATRTSGLQTTPCVMTDDRETTLQMFYEQIPAGTTVVGVGVLASAIRVATDTTNLLVNINGLRYTAPLSAAVESQHCTVIAVDEPVGGWTPEDVAAVEVKMGASLAI